MKKVSRLTITALVALFACVFGLENIFAQAPDADAILQALEKNQVYVGFTAEGSITIQDKFGTRKNTFIMKNKGDEYSLMEFTSSAERGQKVLRVKDKIYLYYPDAEEVITLNQSMFQRSLLDSDISYDDIAGDKSISSQYTAQLQGSETIDGVDCYILFLTAKDFKKVSYGYQKIWVNKANLTAKKSELYTRSKKLRKTLTVHAQEKRGSVYISTDIEFSDALKKTSSTRIVLSNSAIIEVKDDVFSIEALKF